MLCERFRNRKSKVFTFPTFYRENKQATCKNWIHWCILTLRSVCSMFSSLVSWKKKFNTKYQMLLACVCLSFFAQYNFIPFSHVAWASGTFCTCAMLSENYELLCRLYVCSVRLIDRFWLCFLWLQWWKTWGQHFPNWNVEWRFWKSLLQLWRLLLLLAQFPTQMWDYIY